MSVIDVQSSEPDGSPEFVDHSSIDWRRVRRTRFVCHQRFHYAYPGPIRDLRHALVVVPAERYGDQRLREHRVSVAPSASPRTRQDAFGNRVFEFELTEVGEEIAFDVSTTVERSVRPRPHRISSAQAEPFRAPTRLTSANDRIVEIASELEATSRDSTELAERIHEWVSDALEYVGGATAVHTTAAEALALGSGLCQDYAHVMLAVCRAADLPARYVSGHMPGEGGSHAWVEVLVPSDRAGELRPMAFDPTNRRVANLGYSTVAIGRDYDDVPPTSGTFCAPYGGRLSFTKRAGLTLVVMADGEVIRAV